MIREKTGKTKANIEGATQLSLGISMVVAIAFGIGIGLLMRDIFDTPWLFWLGVVWGIGAAILNVYKAYKAQQKEYDAIANDTRYQNHFDKDSNED